MTDLTEQWKKGKLTGEYWCEITESPYPEQVYLPTCDSDIIVKVLAPVPSYEEWQAKLEENTKLKERLKKTQGLELEVRKENTKLKADCHTLAQTLLKVKPELREWLEANFKEYL